MDNTVLQPTLTEEAFHEVFASLRNMANASVLAPLCEAIEIAKEENVRINEEALTTPGSTMLGDIATQLELTAEALEASSSVDELIDFCQRTVDSNTALLQENKAAYYAAAEQQRRTCYAVERAYQYPSEHAMICCVDYGFGKAGSSSWTALKKQLAIRYGKFRYSSNQSPTHISLVMDLPSLAFMGQFAAVCRETLALGFIQLQALSREGMLNYLNKNPLTKPNVDYAFVVPMASSGILNGVYADAEGKRPLYIPAAGAFGARQVAARAGADTFGLPSAPMPFDDAYPALEVQLEDAETIGDLGANIFLEETAELMVNTTAYKGDLVEYQTVTTHEAKMMIANAMTQYARQILYTTVDGMVIKSIREQILKFLGDLKAGGGILKEGVELDPNWVTTKFANNHLSIKVEVPLKGVAKGVSIHLRSSSKGILPQPTAKSA